MTTNQYPAKTIKNHSLAKTASTLAIYIPFYEAQENVNFVHKEEPPKMIGGEDLGLKRSASKDMEGKGIPHNDDFAFEHPIKVPL